MVIKLNVYVCLKYNDIHVHQEPAVWRLARRVPAGLGLEGPGSGPLMPVRVYAYV